MTGAEWTMIAVALIGAGLLNYVKEILTWWRNRRISNTPEAKEAASIATVDQSLTVVAKARDELEADNTRLRGQIADQDARFVAEIARRDAREASLMEEITRLETKVREILAEVESLKFRHGPNTNPNGMRAIRV